MDECKALILGPIDPSSDTATVAASVPVSQTTTLLVSGRGLTPVHFSPHPEPLLSLTLVTNHPAYSTKSAYAEPESGRV